MASTSNRPRHVAAHLGIKLSEYDERIRTFIPHYEDMLEAAAAAVPPDARRILDLGIGTGALASQALVRAPRASVTGIDADDQILALAARRLGARGTFVCGSFLRAPVPTADAIVSSFALHHVRTRSAKARLYHRLRMALRRGGVLVSADCHPAEDRRIAAAQMQAWRAHVSRSYSAARTTALLQSWRREDVYVPLDVEQHLLRQAGFHVEVTWRRDAFAVLVAR
jgi:trans-aconitate methyltransferase